VEVFVFSFALTVLVPIALLWPLERFFPANPAQPFWRRDSRLDVFYWLSVPVLRGALTALVAIPVLILGLDSEQDLAHGFGPIAEQPGWLQALEFVVLFDLICYWVHRTFHNSRLWKFHAVHHSSLQLDWLSTVRHHPVNEVAMRIGQSLPMLLLGFSPTALAWCFPLFTVHSLLIHSNLKWTFGPFRHILVSPAFHHWHHTSQPEGIDKNFAEICPLWDRLFGTYYFPDKLPEHYGVHDPEFPDRYFAQLAYPFRRAVK